MVEYDKVGGIEISINMEGKWVLGAGVNHPDMEAMAWCKEIEGELIGVEVFLSDEGGSFVGRAEVLNKGERAHIFHFEVSSEHRRNGIGSALIDATGEYITHSPYSTVSGRIKNGGTAEFLEKEGFNPKYVHSHHSGEMGYEVVSITDRSSVETHGNFDFNRAEEYYNGVDKRKVLEQW